MDEGRFSVSAASVYARLGTASAPILIDVRRRPAFEADEWMVAGAVRRGPDTVQEWGMALPKGGSVVVYCSHGQEVSRNAAASLRGIGIDARYLDGGIADWAERKLPLRKKRRSGIAAGSRASVPRSTASPAHG